jgi:hypothetical protein
MLWIISTSATLQSIGKKEKKKWALMILTHDPFCSQRAHTVSLEHKKRDTEREREREGFHPVYEKFLSQYLK